MADLMVTATEAERTRSINSPSEMPFFAEAQTDIKARPVKSCIHTHFTFCSNRRPVSDRVDDPLK